MSKLFDFLKKQQKTYNGVQKRNNSLKSNPYKKWILFFFCQQTLQLLITVINCINGSQTHSDNLVEYITILSISYHLIAVNLSLIMLFSRKVYQMIMKLFSVILLGMGMLDVIIIADEAKSNPNSQLYQGFFLGLSIVWKISAQEKGYMQIILVIFGICYPVLYSQNHIDQIKYLSQSLIILIFNIYIIQYIRKTKIKNDIDYQQSLQYNKNWINLLAGLPVGVVIINQKTQKIIMKNKYVKELFELAEEEQKNDALIYEKLLSLDDLTQINNQILNLNRQWNKNIQGQNDARRLITTYTRPSLTEEKIQTLLKQQSSQKTKIEEVSIKIVKQTKITFKQVLEEFQSSKSNHNYPCFKTQIQLENKIKYIELNIGSDFIEDQDVTVLIIKDISESGESKQLQFNREFKDRVFASFSHELRTPLNGSMGILQAALDDEEISENQKDNYLRPALNSLNLLLYQINDILDYSQINAHQLHLIYSEFFISDIVNDVISLIKIPAKMKNLELKVNIDNQVPQKMVTDYNRLAQILLNLLNNALKFTISGSIEVNVKPNPEGFSSVIFEVKDTGIGIKSDDLKRIQMVFSQLEFVDFTISSHTVGIGLGLTISHLLALLIGKTGLTVDSCQNGGSTFQFIVNNRFQALISQQNLSQKLDQQSRILPMEQSPQKKDYSIKDNFEEALGIQGMQVQSILKIEPVEYKDEDEICEYKQESEMNIQKFLREHEISPNIQNLMSQQYKNDVSEAFVNPVNVLVNQNMIVTQEKYLEKIEEVDEIKKCECHEILLVDDNDFNLAGLKMQIEKQGYKCHLSYNGKDAIEQLVKKYTFDRCSVNCKWYQLVIMDVNMPIMDGLEATKRIRHLISNNSLAQVNIVGCSAFVYQKEIQTCYQAGMDDFLSKPVLMNKLKMILAKWCPKELQN